MIQLLSQCSKIHLHDFVKMASAIEPTWNVPSAIKTKYFIIIQVSNLETKESFLREACTILLVTSQSSQSLPIPIVVSILNVLTHRQYPVQYQTQGQCPDKKNTLHLFRLLYDLRAFFLDSWKNIAVQNWNWFNVISVLWWYYPCQKKLRHWALMARSWSNPWSIQTLNWDLLYGDTAPNNYSI